MKKTNMKFKPLDNVHIAVVAVYFLFFCVLLDIAFLMSDFSVDFFITVLIVNLFPWIVFISARILYRTKYVIDDEYFTKYKGKTILFRIRICDIKSVYIKKRTWYAFFAFLIGIFGLVFITKYMTNISMVFKTCDITSKDDHEITRLSLKPQEDKDCFELCEIVSYHRCMQLCKVLKIEPTFV